MTHTYYRPPYEPFGTGVIRLAAATSPTYGGLCGVTCALATGFPPKEAALLGGIVGLFIGLLCVPFLALFFHRKHTVVDSLLKVLLPSVLCAGVGGLAHGAFGVLLSITTYVSLATFMPTKPPRFPPHHCQSCGYNMSGINTSRCPECGVSPTNPSSDNSR